MINIIALNKFFVLSTCNRFTEERQKPILHSISSFTFSADRAGHTADLSLHIISIYTHFFHL